MRPPEKFLTVTRLCAADQRYEGWKPEPRAYLKGLDVRTMSGRRRDIFLDILFIERNQAIEALIDPARESYAAWYAFLLQRWMPKFVYSAAMPGCSAEPSNLESSQRRFLQRAHQGTESRIRAQLRFGTCAPKAREESGGL